MLTQTVKSDRINAFQPILDHLILTVKLTQIYLVLTKPVQMISKTKWDQHLHIFVTI